MAFEKHPDFEAPANSKSKIWRYMDLAKFLSIIDKSSLFFTRLDQLSEFDPFEGSYTKVDILFEKLKFEDMSKEWKEVNGLKSEEVFNAIVDSRRKSRDILKYNRETTFINSWNLNEYESAAMWKLYLCSHEGIAIQSTYEKLIQSGLPPL